MNSTSSFRASVTVEAELPGTEDWKGRCSGCAQACQEEEEKVALKEKHHRTSLLEETYACLVMGAGGEEVGLSPEVPAHSVKSLRGDRIRLAWRKVTLPRAHGAGNWREGRPQAFTQMRAD